MKNRLSVIICTYNPDESIFIRCLDAVKKASAVYSIHEILIIDNNSANKFSEKEYCKTFCNDCGARVINESVQGLTPARLKGIKEATGEILVFIDDDNLVKPDFFSQGMLVASDNQHIGAWSGKVVLEFEKDPGAWAGPYLGLLVKREIENDYWSNMPHLTDTMPCGAGLFVRKQVADYYVHLHETGKRDIQLDRTGSSLLSAGDNDLAACACDVGMGVGVFCKIELVHYIPAFRIEKEYLLKLAKGISASTVVFHSFRGKLQNNQSLKRKMANQLRYMLKSPLERDFFKAALEGEKDGFEILKTGK